MKTTFYIKQDLVQLLDWEGNLITYDVPLHLIQFDQQPIPTWTSTDWTNHIVTFSSDYFGGQAVYTMADPMRPFMWTAQIATDFNAPIYLWADDTAHGGQLLVGGWMAPLDGQQYKMILDPYSVNLVLGYGGAGFQMMPGEIACVPEPSTYGVALGLVMLGVAVFTRIKRQNAS
jgi:hypothetical protein